MIQYNFPTVIIYGGNSINEIPKRLEGLGLQNCMLVTDSGLISAGIINKFLLAFQGYSIRVKTFSDVNANPIEKNVVDGVQFYKDNNCDCIIAVGGGSPMDVAKTIRFMSVHPFPLEQYDDAIGGDKLITNPMPSLFAVPTTAGTGSEVGRSSVITLASTGKKTIFFHPGLMPDIAILDPTLTIGLPPHITSATGIDAFTHCYEAFIVDSFHPMSDAIALKGMALIIENLPKSIKNGSDLIARGNMLISATMGATAFQKGLGMTHSMTHPLSAKFGLHHGLANALCLPICIEHTIKKSESISELKIKLKQVTKLFNSTKSINELPNLVQNFIENLGIKMGLNNYEIKTKNIRELSRLAYEDACHQTHPYSVTIEDFNFCFKGAL